ncbi:MAG: type II toxin-antitoxin system YafQ family toxin [Prevotellaceae bacterium]|nr:type II toxin-antitoxin system YafQ family toxin [Prevotellaceae bacterium]
MYDITYSTKFRKDYKLIVKRRWNVDLLRAVITQLADNKLLAPKHKDHRLHGMSYNESMFTKRFPDSFGRNL